MCYRGKQHESGDAGWTGKRKRRRDRAAERMTEEYKTLDADPVEGLHDQRGLACWRCIRCPARPVAPAVTGTIYQDNAAVQGKVIAEGMTQVLEIAACAVHEDDRQLFLDARRAKLLHMQPSARDLDKPA